MTNTLHRSEAIITVAGEKYIVDKAAHNAIVRDADQTGQVNYARVDNMLDLMWEWDTGVIASQSAIDGDELISYFETAKVIR